MKNLIRSIIIIIVFPLTTFAATISGTVNNDELFGTAEDDTIRPSHGDDVTHAGAGDDLVNDGGGDDLIYGEDGDDVIRGSNGDDYMYGGDGDDHMAGGAGDDYGEGGVGHDWIGGDPGDDVFYGGLGDDHLRGGQNNDYLNGGLGNDYLAGSVDADVFAFTFDADMGIDYIEDFNFGAGDRFEVNFDPSLIGVATSTSWNGITSANASANLLSTSSNGMLLTYAGIDFAFMPLFEASDFDLRWFDSLPTDFRTRTLNEQLYKLPSGDAVVIGTDNNESFNATWGDDSVHAGAGDDWIDLGIGHDMAWGGDGNDIVNGGPYPNGREYIYGQNGDDLLFGNNDNDFLYGGDGNDVIFGGTGVDRIAGDAGNDYLSGGPGDDNIRDTKGGDDVGYGGSGRDIIITGNGDDLLIGDAGNDVMIGGRGSDVFVLEVGQGLDTIVDFWPLAGDKFAVTGNTAASTIASVTFITAGRDLLVQYDGMDIALMRYAANRSGVDSTVIIDDPGHPNIPYPKDSFNDAPRLVHSGYRQSPDEETALSDLYKFQDSDAGDRLLRFEIIDNGGGTGRIFNANTGGQLGRRNVYRYDVDEMNNLFIREGAAADTDDIQMRAFDGAEWSNWLVVS